MSKTTRILFIVSLGALLFAGDTQSKEQADMTNGQRSQAEPRTRLKAKAKINVQNSEVKPYDQTANPALMEIRISETFSGDIDGGSRREQIKRRAVIEHCAGCRERTPESGGVVA